MGKFLRDVNVEGLNTTPSFINKITNDEQEIVRTATSGTRLGDIALDTAIKYAKNLEAMKGANEQAELQIGLNTALQDYEVEFTKSGKSKYDNYTEYKNGINDIYNKYKGEVVNKKNMNQSQVLSWDNSLEQNRANKLYVIDGEQAQYQIKKQLDETAINISSLCENFISTGNEELINQALDMYDQQSSLGVDKATIEQGKLKLLIQSQSKRLQYEVDEVIANSDLNIEEKRKEIARLQNNLMNKDVYKTSTEKAIKNGWVSKNFAEAYENQLIATYKDNFLDRGKLIDKYNTAIRNDKYRTDTELKNEVLKRENSRLKETAELKNSLRTGDDFKVLSIIEGRDITGYDLIENQDLSMKYYGRTPQDILQNSNEYIPTTSKFEINELKNKNRIDYDNKIPRDVTVGSMYENLNNLKDNEKENLIREYVANGVLSQWEVDLNSSTKTQDGRSIPKIQFNRSAISKEEAINFALVGSQNYNLNKINGFVGINSNSMLGKATQNLDFYQRQQVSELITGAIVNNKFSSLFNPKDLTIGTINQQYNSNLDFRNYVDDVIDAVKNSTKQKYKKANMINKDYESMVESKYKDKPINIRVTTKEKGTEPVIQEYNTNYIQF